MTEQVPERVEKLLELAKHHGRMVTRTDVRLHPHGYRVALTASTALHIRWQPGKVRGGRLECSATCLAKNRSRRLTVAATQQAIISGTVAL